MSYHLISSVPTTCTTSDLIIKLFKDNHKEEPEYTNQDEIVTAIKEAYNIDTKQPAVSKALQKLIGSQFEFDKQTYILYKGYASYDKNDTEKYRLYKKKTFHKMFAYTLCRNGYFTADNCFFNNSVAGFNILQKHQEHFLNTIKRAYGQKVFFYTMNNEKKILLYINSLIDDEAAGYLRDLFNEIISLLKKYI